MNTHLASKANGDSEKLLGYADARIFAKELVAYLKRNEANKAEYLLNGSPALFAAEVNKYFSSYNSHVVEGKDSYAVAQEMIYKKNEVAAVSQFSRIVRILVS